MKKNIFKLLAIVAVLALIGAFAAACDDTTLTLDRIELKEGTLPTELAQFSTPDFSGVKILAIYNDETMKEFSTGLTFSEVDTNTLGQKTVSVTYGGITASFTVNVVLASNLVSSIAMKADTYADEVFYGATYNYADIIVELTYSNDYVQELDSTDSRLTIGTVDTEILGNQIIAVSFTDEFNTTPITTSFEVDVVLESLVIESIAAKSGTYEPYIEQTTNVDFAPLIITVTYDNDVVIDYPWETFGVVITGIDSAVLGTQSIQLSYTDAYNLTPITASYEVTVVQISFEITSIAVKAGTYPEVVYRDGTPDFSGVSVTATYTNLVRRTIYAPDLAFSVLDTTTVGMDKVVTVSYSDAYNTTPLTATFAVDVIISPYLVNSITVDEASVLDIAQYSQADFDGVAIVVNYLDTHTANINGSNANVTFSTVETNTLGVKTVTASYRDAYNDTPITDTFSVTVVSVSSLADGYQIVIYEMPGFISTYLSNVSASTSGENAYLDKDAPYYVGSLNSFTFLPNITAIKVVGGVVTGSKVLTSYTSNYKVERWNGTAYVELTGAGLSTYLTIDGTASSFDFEAAAVGESFRLTLNAKAGDIYGGSVFDPLVLEVEVIDAYNVYNAADLSVFDNFNNHGYWTEVKENNDIDPDLDVNGIVLHNNIAITPADLPSDFFYSAANADPATYKELGSLKRWSYIYVRSGDTDETFNFMGNYFSIDASAIPLGTEKDSEIATPLSYSSLFCFLQSGSSYSNIVLNGGTEGITTASGTDTVSINAATNNMSNVTLIGNATRAPGEDEIVRMGGLIMIKSNAHMLNMYNTIMRRSFTDIYVINGESNFLFEKSKTYDAYSNSMMFYENIYEDADPDTKTMLIKDSTIKRCGGPALILDDYDTGTGSPSAAPNMVYVEIEDSIVESYVQGTEGWFKANSADTALAQIKGLDLAFNPYERTYLKDDQSVNIVALMMPNNPFTDEYVLRAWLKIDGVVVSDTRDLVVLEYEAAVGGGSPAAPVFQSSANGVCFSDGEHLLVLNPGPVPVAPGPPVNPVLTGDYITCYAKPGACYIGIVMGGYTTCTP